MDQRDGARADIFCKPSFFNCQLSLTLSQLVKLPSKIVHTAFGFQLVVAIAVFLCVFNNVVGDLGDIGSRGGLALNANTDSNTNSIHI
jgi:hypothetical protein